MSKMIYLVYGDKFFSRFKIKEIFPNGFTAVDFSDGADETVLAQLGNQNLFSSINVVIRNFVDVFGVKELNKILGGLKTSSNNVVFWDEDLPANLLKVFKKYEAKITEVSEPKGKAFGEFLNRVIADTGLKFSPEAKKILELIFRGSPANLLAEIEKLRTLGRTVTPELIYQIIRRPPTSYFFEIVDAALVNDKKRSLQLLKKELESGTDSLSFLAVFISSFRNIAFLKYGHKPKVPPFVLSKLDVLKNRFSHEKLSLIFDKLAEADLKIKTGRNPVGIIEDFILSL